MPRGGDGGYSDRGSLANFVSGLISFKSAAELLSFVFPALRSSACRGTHLESLAVSVRPDAAAKATDEATDADCMSSAQLRPPIFGAFSGTMIVSPARNVALIGSPPHQPSLLFFAAITEPSARTTNTAFLSASSVTPPAWLRYHLALWPGRNPMAVGLNTWPFTIT